MLRRVLALGLFVLPGCALGPAAPSPKPLAPAAAPPSSAQPRPAAGAPPGEAAGEEAAAVAAAAFDEELAALDDEEEEEAGTAHAFHTRPAPSSPLLALGDAELEAQFKRDPASVGSISAGPPRGGVLVNGVQMPKGDGWLLLDPGRAWGTQATVDALQRIIGRVNERYPGSPALPIGHISAKNGGRLSPHLSHQSGRDADVGYYYRSGIKAFVSATAENLDMPRTWALVKAAIRETEVEMILMDTSVQRILADYALQNGEDPNFVDEAFQVRGKSARAPIRHIRGHKNHLHFRFHDAVAEELGRRLARHIALPKPSPPGPVTSASHAEVAGVVFTPHKARSGDTLVILAKRYGTTVEDIQRANNLKSAALKAGAIYRIPQKAPPPKAAPPAGHKPGSKHPPQKPKK